MLLYYCVKCKKDNLQPVCSDCGHPLPPGSAYFRWQVSHLPIADGQTIGFIMRIALYTGLFLVLALFVTEFLLTGYDALDMLTGSGILPPVLIACLGGIALALFVLGLQGREELHFTVSPKGAKKEVWIEPTRLKCLSRLIAYDEYAFKQDPEGKMHLMVCETTASFEDMRRAEIRKHASRIDLYRPPVYLFLSLRIPRDEFDSVLSMISPKIRHIVKKT